MLRKCFIIIFCIFFCLFSAICEKVNPDRIDEISRVYLTKDKVDGYVFFEGFDFAGYKPEPLGIKIMLDRTYEILKTSMETNVVLMENRNLLCLLVIAKVDCAPLQ